MSTDNVSVYDAAGKLLSQTQVAVPVTRDNATQLRAAAQNALTSNRTFLNAGTLTTAQSLAQVKALTQQNQALIRIVLGLLDATD